MTDTAKLAKLAKDLTKDFPRSPRETLGGYVLAARMVDKGRAVLNNTGGEYHFDCPLDNIFFSFAGITGDAIKPIIASGASDADIGQWIESNAQKRDRTEIVAWNNKMRDTRMSDLPPDTQVRMEDYIKNNLPANKPVYHWFDVFDIEEKRI